MTTGYEHLSSAAEIHRARARLLRLVVMQRWMEMRAIIANATEPSVLAVMARADSALYERVLKADAELEELAAQKERA